MTKRVFQIYRYDPDVDQKPRMQTIEVELDGSERMLLDALIKLKRTDEAIAAYTSAAALDPHPAVAYFNLCATQYNVGNMTGAATACDEAIKADPTKADAYFIKGSALYGNGTLDATNTYVVPPGTLEALRKYLKLAPKGAHVADVQAMLDALKKPLK